MSLILTILKPLTSVADVVLPNGTFTTVSETHGSDIFYALQGGVNNFGIVTSFTLKTHPMGQVWGGTLNFPADKIDALINATAEYSTNGSLDEPKAIMVSQLYATNGTVTGAASEYLSSSYSSQRS
jgi:FAD/FMN-containing dehydrogenase